MSCNDLEVLEFHMSLFYIQISYNPINCCQDENMSSNDGSAAIRSEVHSTKSLLSEPGCNHRIFYLFHACHCCIAMECVDKVLCT